MRLYTAPITSNTEIRPTVHLLEIHLPQLAQSIQPGQYCMLRCCHPAATDPLLRRPFFVHTVQRNHGLCTFLVHVQGRGTAWLASQPVGSTLDILAPLGHGWELRSTVRNLLLVSEGTTIPALTLLAQTALEQELVVTLVAQFATANAVYPPALLPSEVEYHIVTTDGSLGQQGTLAEVLNAYVSWADAACLSVSHETSTILYRSYERLRGKHFAQGTILSPLVCGNGVCLTCSVETTHGTKLICRDGPVFPLRDIAR